MQTDGCNAPRLMVRHADAHLRNQAGDWHRWRSAAFAIGDGIFLTLIGAATTAAMHMMHELGWSFVPACLVGMAVAMIGQTLLSWFAAPLLGSIESMAPSMVVGMLAPMSVCTLHLLGCQPGPWSCIALGATLGAGMFLFVQWYGAAYRRSLRRVFLHG